MNKFKSHFLLSLIVYSLFFASVVYNQQLNDDLFSPENRLSFANYLYENKDYLRALDEFRSYLKFRNNDTVRYHFADSFFRIGRYDEAADNFKGLFFGSPLSEEAKLGFYKSKFFSRDKTFRESADVPGYLSKKYKTEIDRLFFISQIQDNILPSDTAVFFSAFPDSNRGDIKKYYMDLKNPKYKNEGTAALLSTLIPGLGKIYTGEIGDGITSFITTGLLVFLSINNFNNDHHLRGMFFAGLSALSYVSGIYGSAASAQIYNAGVKFNLDNDIKFYFEKRNYFLPKLDF